MTDWVQVVRRSAYRPAGTGSVWGFAQIRPFLAGSDTARSLAYLGTWPPLRHVWHVTGYERWLALPAMKQWLGAPLPPGDCLARR